MKTKKPKQITKSAKGNTRKPKLPENPPTKPSYVSKPPIKLELGMRVMDTFDDDNTAGELIAFDAKTVGFLLDNGELDWCDRVQIAIVPASPKPGEPAQPMTDAEKQVSAKSVEQIDPWTEAIQDPAVRDRLEYFARYRGELDHATLLLAIVDRWDQASEKDKYDSVLYSMKFVPTEEGIFAEKHPVDRMTPPGKRPKQPPTESE